MTKQRRYGVNISLLIGITTFIVLMLCRYDKLYLEQNVPKLQRRSGKYGYIEDRFQRLNPVNATIITTVFDRLEALTSRKAESLDPELVQFVRDVIDPPATEGKLKLQGPIIQTPQSLEVGRLLTYKHGGFFVECGGSDGELASNTIHMEKEKGWTGILIEMNPLFYKDLRGKNRRSLSLNACLSPFKHVIVLPSDTRKTKLAHTYVNFDNKTKAAIQMVPCFPFETVMAALNRTHIDYFSLDVEGFELEILKTINFDKIRIDVLSVEYIHSPAGKQATLDYMLTQGYRLHKDISYNKNKIHLYVEDYIFVKI